MTYVSEEVCDLRCSLQRAEGVEKSKALRTLLKNIPLVKNDVIYLYLALCSPSFHQLLCFFIRLNEVKTHRLGNLCSITEDHVKLMLR